MAEEITLSKPEKLEIAREYEEIKIALCGGALDQGLELYREWYLLQVLLWTILF